MWKKELSCALFCLFCQVFVLPAAELQDVKQLQTTSSNIQSKLQQLKTDSLCMSKELMQLSESLKVSKEEQIALKRQSMELSISLMTISEELTASYKTITSLEKSLAIKNKVVEVLIVIIVIRLTVMLIGFILYAKGVKLPHWVEILI